MKWEIPQKDILKETFFFWWLGYRFKEMKGGDEDE